MKALRDFGCGAVVGVANIIPGVSGGTMAVVLGVYAQLLEAMGLKNLDDLRAAEASKAKPKTERQNTSYDIHELEKIDTLDFIN